MLCRSVIFLLHAFFSAWWSGRQYPPPDLWKLGGLSNSDLWREHKLSVSVTCWYQRQHNTNPWITCCLYVFQLFPEYRGRVHTTAPVQVQHSFWSNAKIKDIMDDAGCSWSTIFFNHSTSESLLWIHFRISASAAPSSHQSAPTSMRSSAQTFNTLFSTAEVISRTSGQWCSADVEKVSCCFCWWASLLINCALEDLFLFFVGQPQKSKESGS